MRSLLLDRSTWDLVVDAAGNLAVCFEPYAIAQDVACAVRTFKGEMWYDVTRGIPYFEQVIGQFSTSLYAAFVNQESLLVPGVDTVKTIITGFTERRVTGQIQLTDIAGNFSNVSLNDTGTR